LTEEGRQAFTSLVSELATRKLSGALIRRPYNPSRCNGGRMRLSLDWWAVLAAAVAVILIKTGFVSGIPW